VTPAPGRSIHRLGLGINTQPVVGAQGNVSSYGGQPRAESEWLTGNGDAIRRGMRLVRFALRPRCPGEH
jgi:hypothetical protein